VKNIVPIITPFYDTLEVDIISIITNVSFLYENGIRHILVGGHTGEGRTLSNSERRLICSTIKSIYPDMNIIGCIDCVHWESIKGVIDSFHTEYLLVNAPVSIKPSKEDLNEFFRFILTNSNKKIIVCDAPLDDLSEDLLGNNRILGARETKFNSIQSNGMRIWCGDDLYAIKNLDFYGLITKCSNILPQISNEIVNKNLSLESTELWQMVAMILAHYSNPIAIKYILHKKGIIRSDSTRFTLRMRDTSLIDKIIDNIDI
jgi:dihydrodipicolinate synthase/N-acetylneuraminate lyase